MSGSNLPEVYRPLIKRCARGDFWMPTLSAEVDRPASFATRQQAEEWMADNLPKLIKAGVKVRRCLCCQGQFLSHGAHNRMCQTCRSVGSAEASPVSFSFKRRSASHV